jgi:hypothetical protein
MKDKDFHKLIGLNWTGAGWLNANESAIELSDGTKNVINYPGYMKMYSVSISKKKCYAV